MDRRRASKLLFASAAGASLVAGKANAQTCTLPCYPQTASELAANVTPTDLQYLEGDARRYGAKADNSTDDSTAHQTALDVLAQKGGGTWTIAGGVSRAQGLVCRASDIEIIGDGWLKPVNNGSADHIVQFGEDSSNTTLFRVKGHLRVGDPLTVMSTWSNIVGVKLERAASFDLRIDAPGLGVGIDAAGKGGGIQFCTFHLGAITNCKVGVRLNPQIGGWANENLWIGGRFSQNTGTWESGVAHIQAVDNGGSEPNGNVFLKPAFEGVGRCVDFDNAVRNHIVNARWEGGAFSGTEGVDFEAVLFKIRDNCLRNSIEISQGQDLLLSNAKNHGAASRNSNGVLFFPGIDKTAAFRRGTPIRVTVSGTTHTLFATSSSFSGGRTLVYVSRPVITTAPTAVVAPRIEDEGFSVWKHTSLNIAISGVLSATGPHESTEFGSQAHLRTHWVMNAKDREYPAIVYCRGGDQATGNKFYEVRDRFQALQASLDDQGYQYVTRFSVGNQTTPRATRSHVADPSGGAIVDTQARTAINAILATLEAYGFHSTG